MQTCTQVSCFCFVASMRMDGETIGNSMSQYLSHYNNVANLITQQATEKASRHVNKDQGITLEELMYIPIPSHDFMPSPSSYIGFPPPPVPPPPLPHHYRKPQAMKLLHCKMAGNQMVASTLNISHPQRSSSCYIEVLSWPLQ